MFSFKEINTNTTIITPNRRLSATLHKQYQAQQLEEQLVWQTADILPLHSWIERLFTDYQSKTFAPTPHLLSSTQEQYVWETILQKTQEKNPLLQVAETAKQVQSAYALLKQWQVDFHDPLFQQTPESAALQQWIFEFEKRARIHHWLTSASLPEVVSDKIKSGEIQLKTQLILVGFTELSPQLKQLLLDCEALGSEVKEISVNEIKATSQRLSLVDTEKEIWTMARFAKNTAAKYPTANIGCVLPSLDKMRDRVQQIFSAVFSNEDAFNISAGKRLAHYPIINTALQLLSLHKKNINRTTFCYLLASPYLARAESDYIKRSLSDRKLRQNNVMRIDRKMVCEQITQFTQFYALIDQYQQKVSYREWALRFNKLLTTVGWPGERSLSSEEYQIAQRFLDLLQEFMTLDQVGTEVSLSQALETLQNMAKNSLFQAKTPDSRIQILGMLEAAGLSFDYLWIAGMDDLHFPPAPKPHPFIPKRLQRELNMPHATAAREFNFCERLLGQFKQSVKHLIFSHAETEDNLALQASPLIRDLPSLSLTDLALEPFLTPMEQIYQSSLKEKIIDENAPALNEHEAIRGGVSILKQQAACPFKAFAESRLHAHDLEIPLPGMRPKDRGTYLHTVMDKIWQQLQNQTQLLTLSKEALHELVARAIDESFMTQVSSRYLTLEKKRLQQLVINWLEIEKSRPPFTVLKQEEEVKLSLNQLTLSMRIDRIDALADGKKLIVDYKSSPHYDINHWFGERPDEPQLPLYLLLDSANTVGISFAQINTLKNCFKGVSSNAVNIDGIKTLSQWDEQLATWRSTLTKLGDDFYQGQAQVAPKDQAKTCHYCALTPFCRIKEELL